MGAVVLIDYENLPSQSNNIRNLAITLNERLNDVYINIGKMHEYWYGNRYNDMVTRFNSIIPQMNQFLEVIVTEVPYIIESIANNFSEVDIQQKVSAEQKSGVQTIQTLQVTKDVGMRYIEKEVENIKAIIKEEFNEIRNIMEEINGIMRQTIIECENSGEFKSQFNRLSKSFNQSINNIEIRFIELMENARRQMGDAERLNTV